MSEIELKFGLTDEAAAAVEAALLRHGAKAAVLTSHYWDTPERHLAGAGLALRLRRTGETWEQTLKAAGPTPAERLEDTVPRPGEWDDKGPAPEVSLHAASKSGALLDRALSPRKGRPPALELAYRSVIERLALTLVMGDADVELAFDRGTIEAGERSLPVRELELELKRGAVGALIALGRANVDVHGMWLSTLTKSARGSQLALGEPKPAKATPPLLDRSSAGRALFRAIVASCIEQVLANASLLAAGNGDDEVVHQLRVGIRRLRTAWRELGAWHGSLDGGWEAPMGEAFRALGVYRDRKTVAARIEQRLAAAGSPDPELQRPSSSSEPVDPASTARQPSFQHALLDVLAFLMVGAEAIDAAGTPDDLGADDIAPRDTIGHRLGKLHARLKRDAERFETLDPSARHGLRKRLKRLRYLAELGGPLYKTARVRRFLRSLEPAQDELGNYMDLVVAARLAREAVEAGGAQSWFNIGWLKAQIPLAVEQSGRALRKAADAKPFWD